MLESQKYEKLLLIRKIIDSYRLEKNIQDENWLGNQFDKLYEMDVKTLKHLADLRGITDNKKYEVFI